jgi:hypothetical protein
MIDPTFENSETLSVFGGKRIHLHPDNGRPSTFFKTCTYNDMVRDITGCDLCTCRYLGTPELENVVLELEMFLERTTLGDRIRYCEQYPGCRGEDINSLYVYFLTCLDNDISVISV